ISREGIDRDANLVGPRRVPSGTCCGLRRQSTGSLCGAGRFAEGLLEGHQVGVQAARHGMAPGQEQQSGGERALHGDQPGVRGTHGPHTEGTLRSLRVVRRASTTTRPPLSSSRLRQLLQLCLWRLRPRRRRWKAVLLRDASDHDAHVRALDPREDAHAAVPHLRLLELLPRLLHARARLEGGGHGSRGAG
ncbi:DnaJ domain containing protein, partial [Aphelenchoides avenae]